MDMFKRASIIKTVKRGSIAANNRLVNNGGIDAWHGGVRRSRRVARGGRDGALRIWYIIICNRRGISIIRWRSAAALARV